MDFRGPADSPRPLSVIAGAFGTGKTTILEFVDYCLGAAEHPVMPTVRAATLEVELSGTPYLIERAVGEPSTYAYVCPGRLDEPGATAPERRPLRPAGAENSLSSLLLSHCKLEGVRLRDRLAAGDAVTDPLSFRDLMWLCFLPNERLDDRDLLFESVPMKNLKLRQVIDVHDDRAIELGRRIRTLEAALSASREAYRIARTFVSSLESLDSASLSAQEQAAKTELTQCAMETAALDERARSSTSFAADLRERHRLAAVAAREAAALLRDRETQAERMTSLRATYAEDVSKLVMLTEAGSLFPPLRLDVCPSCLTPLASGERRCAACDAPVEPDGPPDVRAELRSARARLAELTEYLESLEQEIPRLRLAWERAQQSESRAAAEVDAATAHAVTPYLAQRDALARRREEAATALQRAVDGLRVLGTLQQRADAVDNLQAQLTSLRDERAMAPAAERASVIGRLGSRFRDILREWDFPGSDDAYVADDLTPFTRGEPYTSASSGTRTLIALAWQLAVFELAWETRSSHPGFLLLDSPQKNLGHDDSVIARVYQHLDRWLAGAGAGAQVVVADNAPPPAADADVIVRFSRETSLFI